jgi:ATP-dependent DNA helicase DinG
MVVRRVCPSENHGRYRQEVPIPSPTDALARVTAQLPAGEERPGQVAMAEAVAEAIETGRHLIVEAGTGTGKTLGYLVPAISSGKRTVVATATKALQDQLDKKDLPFLVEHLDQPFSYSILKGRSNYLCRQRASEIETADEQLGLDGLAERAPSEEIKLLLEWADDSPTGDRAELSFEPSPQAWAAVSVGARECPGASKCPKGEECFAEDARLAATAADVVVVNTHLYGLHLASGGAILPDHDVVIIDEAHQLEDVVSATSGFELSAGRFAALGRVTAAIVDDPQAVADLNAAGARLGDALGEEVGRRLRQGVTGELADAVAAGRLRAEAVLSALRAVPDDGPGDVSARKQRAMRAATALLDDVDAVLDVPPTHVAWVEGPDHAPTLRVAPVDVAEVLRATLWDQETVVLTSATIPPHLDESLGLEPDDFVQLDVGSPFDYDTNALLYCAAHLPDPRTDAFDPALHDELAALIAAAGGRTLALFTSWRAMHAAAEALADEVPGPLLTQSDLPKPALVDAFTADESSCLFATMGFWQGVDIPGRSLSLVTIDRLPFPRPDEPLLQARRERARQRAFAVVDLPRAATMLAQGAGRLIRTATDRGVVAVFDPRLATARYRWDIVNALPPMRRTKDRAEVEAFLQSLA